MSAVERDPAVQATLWRQRVFEVHAAMSAYVAERHRREDLGDWVAFEVQAEAGGRAVFHNRHCAIWDYRERARARGVPITLESACTYCTKLLSAFVAASDCRADWRLYEEPQGHGCVWTITADSLNQGAGVHERDH